MAHQKIMRMFAKWHIWLGWLVGVPILMWTVTGLIMVWHPIQYVRGDHLRAEIPTVETAQLVLPAGQSGPVTDLALKHQADGPAWIVTRPDGARSRFSARNGLPIEPVAQEEARRIALATYAGEGALESVTFFPAGTAPMDLRAPNASWQARFSDDTHVYIHQETGEVQAVRSGWWRVFDFVWGLHIMDLQTREDTSHPILIVFAALGVLGALLGCVLMFRRRKARVQVKA